jgi:hypothetical protein
MAKFSSAVRFKCNQSGNTVEFFQEHEIAEMRKHGGYTEVVVEVVAEPVVTPTVKTTKKVVKDEASIDGA